MPYMKFENSVHLTNIRNRTLFNFLVHKRSKNISLHFLQHLISQMPGKPYTLMALKWGNLNKIEERNLSKTNHIKSKEMEWFSTQYFSTSPPQSWSILARTSTEHSNTSWKLSCSKSFVYKHNQIFGFLEKTNMKVIQSWMVIRTDQHKPLPGLVWPQYHLQKSTTAETHCSIALKEHNQHKEHTMPQARIIPPAHLM